MNDELTPDDIAAIDAAMADPVFITGDPLTILDSKDTCDSGINLARMVQARYPGRPIEVNMDDFEVRLWTVDRRYYVVIARAYMAPPPCVTGSVWVRG